VEEKNSSTHWQETANMNTRILFFLAVSILIPALAPGAIVVVTNPTLAARTRDGAIVVGRDRVSLVGNPTKLPPLLLDRTPRPRHTPRGR
jgi:hypothetical protein